MAALHVVQITDFHIRAEPGARSGGRDSHATLAAVIDAIAAGPAPDFVLATGDLVDDGPGRIGHALDRLGEHRAHGWHHGQVHEDQPRRALRADPPARWVVE